MQRRRGAGRRRATVGGVARQQRQHAAQSAVLLLVGQIAVDDVGDRSEQHVGDRRTLEFVCRTCIHLVERLRRLARLEPPERARRGLTPCHQTSHPVDGLRAVHFVDVRQQLHRVGVVDERFVTDTPQRHRHDVEVHRRQSVQPQLAAHDGRRRNLHGSSDLELVSIEKLDGGSHSARVQLEVQAQRAQPGLLE